MIPDAGWALRQAQLPWEQRQWVKLNFAKNDMSDLAPFGVQEILAQCTDQGNATGDTGGNHGFGNAARTGDGSDVGDGGLQRVHIRNRDFVAHNHGLLRIDLVVGVNDVAHGKPRIVDFDSIV